jgi:D-Ala-teichoic acid biosynthesis protein
MSGLRRLAVASASNPTLRVLALTLYYLAIMFGLVLLYGRGDFSTPSFVYQGF